MELRMLQEHIRVLATVQETEDLMLSCYANFEQGRRKHSLAEIRAAARGVRASIDPPMRPAFEEALRKIVDALGSKVARSTKGVAVFARAGESPFFLALPFEAPLPNWFFADRVPNIYHLVELKDTYDRYVVLIAHEDRARILEVNLGAATKELWVSQPALRERVGREWTRDHYQNHRRDRGDKFIKEKIEILDKLMSAEGHTYLVLAGSPRVVNLLLKKLPRRLADKVVDVLQATSQDATADVVSATLSSFVEHELRESLATAQLLKSTLRRGGLAVAGTAPTLAALRSAQTDILVLADWYSPPPGWRCFQCGHIDAEELKPISCAECHQGRFREVDLKSEMVRLAERLGCVVEIVRESDTLLECGGVGCTLRYWLPEQHAQQEMRESHEMFTT